MLVRIIKGNYGFAKGASITVKTAKDAPFVVPDAEAERLVKLGVAQMVGAGAETSADGSPNDTFGDPADDMNAAHGDEDIPKYSEESTVADLQSIAKEYNIEVPPRANKAQLLEALDEFFGDVLDIGVKEPE